MKKICARIAWTVAVSAGLWKRTLMPPKTAWAITRIKAVKPRLRRKRRAAAGQQDGQHEREDRDGAGHYAMRVFVADAADEWRNNFPVGERPVRYGVGRVVAGDQRAGHQQQNGAGGGGEGEAVKARCDC